MPPTRSARAFVMCVTVLARRQGKGKGIPLVSQQEYQLTSKCLPSGQWLSIRGYRAIGLVREEGAKKRERAGQKRKQESEEKEGGRRRRGGEARFCN